MVRKVDTADLTERRMKLNASTGKELQRLAYWTVEKTPLHFRLINGEEISGRLVWWDLYSLRLELTDGGRIILPKHSILYFGELNETN